MSDALEREIRELRSLYWSEDRDPEGRAFAPLADACRRAGDLAQALELIEDGIDRHPDFSPGHLVAAWVHFDRGDEIEAESAFRRVLELDDENASAMHGLGRILAARGEEAGVEMVLKAQELDPSLRRRGRAVAPDSAAPSPASGVTSAVDSETTPETTPEAAPEATPETTPEAAPASSAEDDEVFDLAALAPEPSSDSPPEPLEEVAREASDGPGSEPAVEEDADDDEVVLDFAALAPDAGLAEEDGSGDDASRGDPSEDDPSEGASPHPESETAELHAAAGSGVEEDDEEVFDFAALAPDPVLDPDATVDPIEDPAADGEPDAVADLSGDDDPDVLDFAALAPDPVPAGVDTAGDGDDGEAAEAVELAELAPDSAHEAPVDLSALAPDAEDDEPIDLGELAPEPEEEGEVVDFTALAPDAEDELDTLAEDDEEPTIDISSLAADPPAPDDDAEPIDLDALAPGDDPWGTEPAGDLEIVPSEDPGEEGSADAPGTSDQPGAAQEAVDAIEAPPTQEDDYYASDEEEAEANAPLDPSELSGEVVTRTMAELFVKQGLLRQAVQVYEKLAELSPADERIAERLDELRTTLAESPAEEASAESRLADEEADSGDADPGEEDGAMEARDDLAHEDMAEFMSSREPDPDPETPFAWTDTGESEPAVTPSGEPVTRYFSGILGWGSESESGSGEEEAHASEDDTDDSDPSSFFGSGRGEDA